MKTQEQQEEEYGFHIISTMEVTEDEDTGELSKQPVVTHLSYKIVVPGKETIFKGFYPKKKRWHKKFNKYIKKPYRSGRGRVQK